MMSSELNPELSQSVKKSYFNILSMFVEQGKMESRYLHCLLKWAVQLKFNPKDISQSIHPVFVGYENKVDRLEAVFHLVYMIYLDNIIEEEELEVATLYAQKLGFPTNMVTDVVGNIATKPYDEGEQRVSKEDVLDLLKMYE